MNRLRFLLAFVLALFLTHAGLAQADVQVDIYGGDGQARSNLAMAAPLTGSNQQATSNGAKLDTAIRENLAFVPFLSLMDSKSIPGGTVLNGYQMPNLDLNRFQLAGADMLITAGWPSGDKNGSTVEMRLYGTAAGNFIFGKAYDNVRSSNIQETADRFCADLMEALTGQSYFFRGTLAFVKSARSARQRNVWIVKPTGKGLRQISSIPGIAMSPSWSPDGRYLVFSHIDDSTHSLAVWNRATGQMQRIRFPGNTVIAPAFLPDNRVAVSLSRAGGYPDIYLLNRSFQKERGLERSPSINVSPTFDSTGTKMAFCSSRLGGPQIFLKNLSTGSVIRVSHGGSYNTEPCISPDGTLVAYTKHTGSGYRIFVHDLATNSERQVTYGPGNDEHPAFAPDSYFLAFTSTRSGGRKIYLTSRHGGSAKLVPTGAGDASFPRWGL
ncbi:MAG: PD40 domain-containing protein [Desulfovibrionaceae bacterium]|nr:PD40 domain-containing protein [Desulfovibrionaceae bacterium]